MEQTEARKESKKSPNGNLVPNGDTPFLDGIIAQAGEIYADEYGYHYRINPEKLKEMLMEMAQWAVKGVMPNHKEWPKNNEEKQLITEGFNDCRDEIISNAKDIGIEL